MSIAERALWIMESRLADPPSLDALAAELNVSRYGLLRAFSARFGETPIAYVRTRRLAEAARALAHGRAAILEIALEAGYQSHSAFLRAFREAFGVTPESIRKAGAPGPALRPAAILSDDTARLSASPPRIETAASAGIDRLVGFATPLSALEAGGIPGLWGTFAARAATYARADGPRLTFGVLFDMVEERPSYACAAPADAFDERPPGFTPIDLPAARYACIDFKAHVSQVRAAWREAWNAPAVHALGTPSAGPDIERYGPNFDPRTGDGGFSLLIPLLDPA